MKKLLCLFLVSIFLCSVGCIDLKKETKYYDLEQDYIELKEYFNRKENSFFQYLKKDLGKDIADKDIPENQFVFPSVSIYSMSNLYLPNRIRSLGNLRDCVYEERLGRAYFAI